jgi:hypothetical protein
MLHLGLQYRPIIQQKLEQGSSQYCSQEPKSETFFVLLFGHHGLGTLYPRLVFRSYMSQELKEQKQERNLLSPSITLIKLSMCYSAVP